MRNKLWETKRQKKRKNISLAYIKYQMMRFGEERSTSQKKSGSVKTKSKKLIPKQSS